MKKMSYEPRNNGAVHRRSFLGTALGACAIGTPLGFVSM
jgi:hypothetical protein